MPLGPLRLTPSRSNLDPRWFVLSRSLQVDVTWANNFPKAWACPDAHSFFLSFRAWANHVTDVHCFLYWQPGCLARAPRLCPSLCVCVCVMKALPVSYSWFLSENHQDLGRSDVMVMFCDIGAFCHPGMIIPGKFSGSIPRAPGPPCEVRWLGWVPGGSNHLLRIWLEPYRVYKNP